ncbi:MAG: hypothetical protein IRZ08_04480 [Frankia sp.]|nr:hypothetical protein [Frankia sp.]
MDVRITPAELIRGRPASIALIYEEGGQAVDPGSVSVTITGHDGAEMWSGIAEGTGMSERTITLTAAQLGRLDQLMITTTSATVGEATLKVPVVGAELFGIGEARRFGDGALADPIRYPDEALIELRARIREAFTVITGQRFVPELVTVTLAAYGGQALLLPDVRVSRIVAVAERYGATWTELSADDLATLVLADSGMILRTAGTWPQGSHAVRLAYECGWPQPPLEIRRAALRLATSYQGLLSSNLPDRALSMSDELGTFRLATPGVGGSWFGLPEVDAVLDRYRVVMPGIG